MKPGEFPEDELPTRPQTFQHRAAELVRNWSDCSPEWQRLLEQLAAEFAKVKPKGKR